MIDAARPDLAAETHPIALRRLCVANYVLEIRKQFGSFQQRVFVKGQAAPDYAGADTTRQTMVASVKESLTDAGVGADDAVFFRNIAYENLDDLLLVVRDAPY